MDRPSRILSLVAAMLASSVLAACGDSGTGPGGDVQFPSLSADVISTFCVRGSLVAPDVASSVISNGDCRTDVTLGVFDEPAGAQAGAFFETWRVRVASRRTLTFEVSSGFDSFLDLYRLSTATDPSSAVLLAFDDDGGQNLNARLQFTLEPSTEYWVIVSGFDETETGSYTLSVGS